MLILTRRRRQSIVIGDGIVVSVLAIEGDRVKLGIEAPSDIAILRTEVVREVGDQNRDAAARSSQRSELLAAVRAVWPGRRPHLASADADGAARPNTP